MTGIDTMPDFEAARLVPKGNFFDDFEIGQVFRHHWGRTISQSENAAFTAQTLSFNPLYFNREFAALHGMDRIQINPFLVFNTIFGLTVEDLSEVGGAFLGVDDLTFGAPVFVGDTVYAASEVTDLRLSESRPEFGIATWRSTGVNQDGRQVIAFTRRNLVTRRGSGS